MAQPLLLAHAQPGYSPGLYPDLSGWPGVSSQKTPLAVWHSLGFAVEAPCSLCHLSHQFWKRSGSCGCWWLLSFACMLAFLGLPCCKYCLWVWLYDRGCFILLGELRRMEQLCSHYHIFLSPPSTKMLMYQG